MTHRVAVIGPHGLNHGVAVRLARLLLELRERRGRRSKPGDGKRVGTRSRRVMCGGDCQPISHKYGTSRTKALLMSNRWATFPPGRRAATHEEAAHYASADFSWFIRSVRS